MPSKPATRIEIGECDSQQDAVIAHSHRDGSWVIAVADGPGSGMYFDEGAEIALSALPKRINSHEEMLRAFAAANAKLRNLVPDQENKTIYEDLVPGVHVTDTTLVVAAWTPENGLFVSWVGDSIPFIFPTSGGWCWWGEPVDISGRYFVGDCAVVSTGEASPTLKGTIRSLNDCVDEADIRSAIESDGLTVVVVSDGALTEWLIHDYPLPLDVRSDRYFAEWREIVKEDVRRDLSSSWYWFPFVRGSEATTVPNLSSEILKSPKRTAAFIMNRVEQYGFHDNTAVAVAIAHKT